MEKRGEGRGERGGDRKGTWSRGEERIEKERMEVEKKGDKMGIMRDWGGKMRRRREREEKGRKGQKKGGAREEKRKLGEGRGR